MKANIDVLRPLEDTKCPIVSFSITLFVTDERSIEALSKMLPWFPAGMSTTIFTDEMETRKVENCYAIIINTYYRETNRDKECVRLFKENSLYKEVYVINYAMKGTILEDRILLEEIEKIYKKLVTDIDKITEITEEDKN
jgi:hypothetical protein